MNPLKSYFSLIALIAFFIISTIILYFYFPEIVNPDNFFMGCVTFLVGSFAIYLYIKQKSDEKINAAISILFEIRNAENKIIIISQKLNSNNMVDLPSVLPTNTWKKYSHLFVRDFDEDELRLINNFYNSCEIIEDLSNRQNNFLWVAAEEKAKTTQKLLGDLHIKFQEETSEGISEEHARRKFNNQKTGLTEFYGNEEYLYTPRKITDGLKFEIENSQKIISTSCGIKLKKMAAVI